MATQELDYAALAEGMYQGWHPVFLGADFNQFEPDDVGSDNPLVCSNLQEKRLGWVGFGWTPRRLDAATLLATDALSEKAICKEVGINNSTLWRWKSEPAFQRKVWDLRAKQIAAIERNGIAIRQRRVASYVQDYQLAEQFRQERGESMQDVPGGSTGMVARRFKTIGAGENAREVEEYEFDTGLGDFTLKVRRQVATELGEWTDKSEQALTGAAGGPIAVEAAHYDYSVLSDEEFATLEALLVKCRRPGAAPAIEASAVVQP